MPCPPSVPISVIPPVSQGVGPLVWANGSQVARLTVPLNPSWLVYDGSVTRWGDGSSQAPVLLPALQEVNANLIEFNIGTLANGQLAKTAGLPTTIANNLAGGAAGQLAIQTAPNATSFIYPNNVEVTATGSTTARTLSNRFTDFVNAKDFGAIGNGIIDDTTAIQSALNYVYSLGGGVVNIDPSKRYLIDSANLTIPPRCGISGQMALGGQEFVYGTEKGNYSDLPNCLVINSAYTINLEDSSFIRGITISRKGITDSSTSVRAGLDNVRAYSGTAITIIGNDTTIQDLFIIGFNQAYYSNILQRNHIFNIQGDNNNQFYFNGVHDTAKVQNCQFWPYMTGNQSYGVPQYQISSVTNNGSGLVRITTTTPNPLITGDLVNITDTNATSANYNLCHRWTITVINSTTFDLQGSVYSTTTKPAGTIYAIPSLLWARVGFCYQIYGASQVNVINCASFGYDKGVYIADSSDGSPAWVNFTSVGFDNYLLARDPNTVAIGIGSGSIATGSFGNVFQGCWVSSYALNLQCNSTRNDVASSIFTGCFFSQSEPENTGNLVNFTNGNYICTATQFGYGLITINSIASAKFSSCQFALGQSSQIVFPGGNGSNTFIEGIRQDGNIAITGDPTSTYGTGQINLNAINKNGIEQFNCTNVTGWITDIPSTASYNAAQFRVNNVAKGAITVTNAGTSYTTTSDYRLKSNVVPLENALQRLSLIKAHRFNWVGDETEKIVDGFLAHEAEQIVPECVVGAKDAVDAEGNPIYQQIDQSKIVPLLFAAIQELLQRIIQLESR